MLGRVCSAWEVISSASTIPKTRQRKERFIGGEMPRSRPADDYFHHQTFTKLKSLTLMEYPPCSRIDRRTALTKLATTAAAAALVTEGKAQEPALYRVQTDASGSQLCRGASNRCRWWIWRSTPLPLAFSL